MKSYLEITEDHSAKFLTEAVHKMKNHLGGIGGFAALLERDLGPKDPRCHLAQRIQNGVIRMNDFVVDLMTFFQNPKVSMTQFSPVRIVKEEWNSFWGEENPPAGVLHVEEELLQGQVELESVEELFRKMVFHAFQFTQHAGNQIDEIHLCFDKRKWVHLQIVFPHTPNLQIKTVHAVQHIQTCEPIEAKLSLYIVIKLATFIRAKTFFSSSSNQNLFSIQFSKGCKHE